MFEAFFSISIVVRVQVIESQIFYVKWFFRNYPKFSFHRVETGVRDIQGLAVGVNSIFLIDKYLEANLLSSNPLLFA